MLVPVLDRVDVGFALHVDAVLLELGSDQGAEVGVDGWEHFEHLLDLSHGPCCSARRSS